MTALADSDTGRCHQVPADFAERLRQATWPSGSIGTKTLQPVATTARPRKNRA